MAQAGVSTLGILFGWANYSDSLPTKLTLLHRINSIGEITLDTEQIDASALEDLVSRYVAGRQDTGGTWDVTINLTDETRAEWETVIAADSSGKGLWFEVYSPYLAEGFYVLAQPPKQIPLPPSDQNALMTVTMSLTINEYRGMSTAVKPTEAA